MQETAAAAIRVAQQPFEAAALLQTDDSRAHNYMWPHFQLWYVANTSTDNTVLPTTHVLQLTRH